MCIGLSEDDGLRWHSCGTVSLLEWAPFLPIIVQIALDKCLF